MTPNLPEPSKTNALTTKKLAPGIILLIGGIIGAAVTHFTIAFLILAATGFVYFLGLKLSRKSLDLSAGPTEYPLTEIIQKQKHVVAQTKYLKHHSTWGQRAFTQVSELESHYKFIMKTLGGKFNATEITYNRYEKSINEMVLLILENLNHLANSLTIFDTKSELNTEAQQMIKAYFDANDEGLKELTQISKALTKINVADAVNPIFEESLERLKVLANQAQLYSNKNQKE